MPPAYTLCPHSSATLSRSSGVKSVLCLTVLATWYWVLAGAECSFLHSWSVPAKFVRWMSKFRFLNFPSSYICRLIFPHYFLDACTQGLRLVNCHFLGRVQLEAALVTLLSVISRVPLWGGGSLCTLPHAPLLSQPVCHRCFIKWWAGRMRNWKSEQPNSDGGHGGVRCQYYELCKPLLSW